MTKTTAGSGPRPKRKKLVGCYYLLRDSLASATIRDGCFLKVPVAIHNCGLFVHWSFYYEGSFILYMVYQKVPIPSSSFFTFTLILSPLHLQWADGLTA